MWAGCRAFAGSTPTTTTRTTTSTPSCGERRSREVRGYSSLFLRRYAPRLAGAWDLGLDLYLAVADCNGGLALSSTTTELGLLSGLWLSPSSSLSTFPSLSPISLLTLAFVSRAVPCHPPFQVPRTTPRRLPIQFDWFVRDARDLCDDYSRRREVVLHTPRMHHRHFPHPCAHLEVRATISGVWTCLSTRDPSTPSHLADS
ncbi:hypothetical protein FA13DRAFT_342406 [Coprinellus micaceus]|uniref:Uncharacterized protein n=1 Tax=Coprinellus micaceus TaxID=71717 RepID=A0A4Y7SF28_COPMI|nr:hypothetical protein FA13DRAFT_342406 [Coprinellus micaceus]